MERRRNGLFFLLGIVLSWGLSFRSTAAWAAGFDYDLPHMIRMNPDFSTYPDAKGIVWLKRVEYGAAPQGGVERRTLWVLLGREGLDERWLAWDVPDPEGGRATVLEASVYSPNGRKIADALPRDPGAAIRRVSFSDLPETFILVVAWKDVWTEKLSLGDFVQVRGELPVWESVVTVTTFSGSPFFYESASDLSPEVTKEGGTVRYLWRSLNLPAFPSLSLRVHEPVGVTFSERRGREALESLLREKDPLIKPAGSFPTPSAQARGAFQKSREAGIAAMLDWLYRQPELVLPEGTSRALPAEAPWTRGEKLLVARAWLAREGVRTRLHWRLAHDPDDAPVCAAMLLTPVLEIWPGDRPSKKSRSGFFCDMETPPQLGKNSLFLDGAKVYTLSDEGKLISSEIPASKGAENRLTAFWNLALSPGGVMGGTVRVQAKNAWRAFLFPAKPRESDLQALAEKLFGGSLKYSALSFQEVKGAAELVVTLKETSGILGTAGKNLLLSLPPFWPRCLTDLADASEELDLKFPFFLEVKLALTLPKTARNVLLAAATDRNLGEVSYTDSYKLVKKKRLAAEALLKVATPRLAAGRIEELKNVLGLWRVFVTRPVPVQIQ